MPTFYHFENKQKQNKGAKIPLILSIYFSKNFLKIKAKIIYNSFFSKPKIINEVTIVVAIAFRVFFILTTQRYVNFFNYANFFIKFMKFALALATLLHFPP